MTEKKERCAICRKTIAKNPVPYYHAKSDDDAHKMYRHENCPRKPPEEIEEE